uniref:Uncharacterized protein n=1 Tax=Anguilla anguilla TaxID=7936 RepID=A0A0E9WZV2_ANGAN
MLPVHLTTSIMYYFYRHSSCLVDNFEHSVAEQSPCIRHLVMKLFWWNTLKSQPHKFYAGMPVICCCSFPKNS